MIHLNNFKKKYSFFIKNNINKQVLRGTIAFSTTVLSIIIFSWTRLPPQLPLYYSLSWGWEQIGTPFELLGVYLLINALFLINSALSILTYESHDFFSRILLFGGSFLVSVSSFSIIKIILLIT